VYRFSKTNVNDEIIFVFVLVAVQKSLCCPPWTSLKKKRLR